MSVAAVCNGPIGCYAREESSLDVERAREKERERERAIAKRKKRNKAGGKNALNAILIVVDVGDALRVLLFQQLLQLVLVEGWCLVSSSSLRNQQRKGREQE